jgi:lysozyme
MQYYKLPDVSFWQDDPTTPLGINFTTMKSQTHGVIIRAGQNVWQDNEFDISWQASKDAGMLRGSYWFYDSRVNPKRQAEKFVEVLGNDLGEMEMWMDFEDRYGGVFGGQRNWFDFAERLKALLPHKPLGVYTGYYYWKEHISSINSYFEQYPLWLAWYNLEPPFVPKPWKEWWFWQYTDNGIGPIYGVESGNIDLNYFNGSEEEFLKRYGSINIRKADLIAKIGNKEAEYRRL